MSEWKNVCTECVNKRELSDLRQRVKDSEGCIERREQLIAKANTERDSAKDAEVVAWGEVDRLQAENDALRARVAELEKECQDAVGYMLTLSRCTSHCDPRVVMLRAQAEAVEACADNVVLGVGDVCQHCEEMQAGGVVMQDSIHDAMIDEAQRLRDQAGEIERGGSDG